MNHTNPAGASENRYPSPDLFKLDPRMARLLCRAYYDELETISTYIYNSILLEEAYPPLASLYEGIAMTEMRHFRMIGKSIRRLGGNHAIRTDLRVGTPDLALCAPQSRIDAVVKQTLRAAISSEQTAAWEYRALADKTRDDPLRELLRRLAADEEEHARLFAEFCNG